MTDQPPRILAVAIALMSLPLAARAQDPLKTDPDKYSLVMENARVRVLKYHDKPGARTAQHQHPDLVLQAITPFKRRLHLPGGKTMERQFKAGEVVFIDGQTHIGENIGTTDTNVVIVELKEPRAAGKQPPAGPRAK